MKEICHCFKWCIFWEDCFILGTEKFNLRSSLDQFMGAFSRFMEQYYDTYSISNKLRVKGSDDESYVPSAYVHCERPDHECYLAVTGPHNPVEHC